jgi:RNA polymerase sigma-70 factor (ECF subfamily)
VASSEFTRELLGARSSLFGFILAMVRDFNLAEELFQEVSVRILEREDEFTPGTNFGAWARAFARRTVLEEQRRRGRVLLDDRAVAAVADKFDDSAGEDSPQREALRRCLEQVNDASRRLVALRYETGLSMGEIGKELGRTAGAVQVALSRVRSWLGECIRDRLATGAEA